MPAIGHRGGRMPTLRDERQQLLENPAPREESGQAEYRRGPREDVTAELARIPGVRDVHPEPHAGPMTTYLLDADSADDLRETIANRIVVAGWGLHEMKSVGYSLEEIFLSLTTAQESDRFHDEAPAEVAV